MFWLSFSSFKGAGSVCSVQTHPASTPSAPGVLEMFGVFCNKLNCVTPSGAGSGLKAESGTPGQDSGLSFWESGNLWILGDSAACWPALSPRDARSTVSSCCWREPPRAGRANSSELGKRTHQEMIKGKRARQNTNRTKQKLPPRERCLAPHRRTDPAPLKQLFGFRSFLFSCTPRCSHGWDELLFLNCCNNVLELFLQPPFLSSLSLSEYSEAILF